MSIHQTERLIQTYQHSNPQVVIFGTKVDSAGVTTIDWKTSYGVEFLGKPILLSITVEGVPTGETAQPICYHQEWVMDGSYYAGMKVYSNGKGQTINWAVQGIVKK